MSSSSSNIGGFLSRRKSNLNPTISTTQNNNIDTFAPIAEEKENPLETVNTNNSISPTTSQTFNNTNKRFERRYTSMIPTTPDLPSADEDSAYVPSLSKNSRRARGNLGRESTSNSNSMNQLPQESNSRGGSQDKDQGRDFYREDSNFNSSSNNAPLSFRERENEKNENSYQPKTLLKSAKSFSPVGDTLDRRESSIERFDRNERDKFSQENKVPSNSSTPYKVFNKQESTLSFKHITTEDKENIYTTTNPLSPKFNPKDSIGSNFTNFAPVNNQEKISQNQNQGEFNPSNTVDIKSALEKEHYESQINSLKTRLEDDKKRYESLLQEEREKSKRKEQDLNSFIEELKLRHKDELKSNEEKNRSTIDSLNEDIKKIRSEIDKEILQEKERMSLLHKSDLESQENIFKKNLENQKKFFEEQNETLKKQLQQQIEFNKLANKVEVSSKQIEDILGKFYQEKDKSIETEKSTLEMREKYLSDLEEKIKENEKMLIKEREIVSNQRRDNELREIEKKRELQEERNRIEKEILRLQELQNSLKVLEFNAKEKYEREKLEIMQKHSEMKIELDTLKNDFHQKLNDLEYNKKIFEEEKKFFEKFKDEAIKNVELKKANLEERKKQMLEEEKEIKGRIKILQEKEYYLKEKFEEFERMRNDNEEMAKKTERDRRELTLAAKRLQDSILNLEEKNKIFESEREEIVRKYQELESERSILNTEKIKIEQSKAELRLRLQSVDMLRIKYVSNNMQGSNMSLTNLPLGGTMNNEYKLSSLNNFDPVSPFPVNQNTNTNLNYHTTQTQMQKISLKNDTNLYNTTGMNNFNQSSYPHPPTNNYLESKLADFKHSKSLSNQSRKSMTNDEYMQNLQTKLRESNSGNNFEEKQNYSMNKGRSDKVGNVNINSYIQQEKEYLRSSLESLENTVRKDYEKLSKEYITGLTKDYSVNMGGYDKDKKFREVDDDKEKYSRIKESLSKVQDSEVKYEVKENKMNFNSSNLKNQFNTLSNVNKVEKAPSQVNHAEQKKSIIFKKFNLILFF
jgi:hypothetical protein